MNGADASDAGQPLYAVLEAWNAMGRPDTTLRESAALIAAVVSTVRDERR